MKILILLIIPMLLAEDAGKTEKHLSAEQQRDLLEAIHRADVAQIELQTAQTQVREMAEVLKAYCGSAIMQDKNRHFDCGPKESK